MVFRHTYRFIDETMCAHSEPRFSHNEIVYSLCVWFLVFGFFAGFGCAHRKAKGGINLSLLPCHTSTFGYTGFLFLSTCYIFIMHISGSPVFIFDSVYSSFSVRSFLLFFDHSASFFFHSRKIKMLFTLLGICRTAVEDQNEKIEERTIDFKGSNYCVVIHIFSSGK